MNFIINRQENVHTDSSITMLIQEISIIFRDQMPTHLVFKKVHYYAGIKLFNSLPPSLTILMNNKAKLKATLRKYLNTQFFSSVDEFPMWEDDVYVLFCKVFVVFYTVKIVFVYL